MELFVVFQELQWVQWFLELFVLNKIDLPAIEPVSSKEKM